MKIQVYATVHPPEGNPRELSFDLEAPDLRGEALEALVKDLGAVVQTTMMQCMGVVSKHGRPAAAG